MFVFTDPRMISALYDAGFIHDADYASAAILRVADDAGRLKVFITKPNYRKLQSKFGDRLDVVVRIAK